MTTTAHSSAMETLVREHVGLVYAAAMRQVRDAHLAEDVTQAVFLILQNKFAKLGEGTVLTAWLLRTTRYACLDAMKRKRRREFHERRAAAMRNEMAAQDHDAELLGLVDEGLAKLGERDRAAVVLAYLEKQPHGEVAARLGISEEAAHKRVQRAVLKLRKFFGKRGVNASAVGIAAALGTLLGAAQAPASVLNGTLAAVGGCAPTSALAIAKGTMTMVKMIKVKLALGILAVAGVAGIGAVAMLPRAHAAPPANPAATNLTAASARGVFEPEVVLTINDDGAGADFLADLDAGKTLTPPRQGDGTPLAMIDWMAENGVDVAFESNASMQALVGLEMAVVPEANEQYDGADPARVLRDLLPSGPSTPAIMSVRGGLPATFAFRTGEGNVGILQIVEERKGRPAGAVVVRYHMIKAGARDRAAAACANALATAMAKQETEFRGAAEQQDVGMVRTLARRLQRNSAAIVELSRGGPAAEAARRMQDGARRLVEAADREDLKGAQRGIEALTSFREVLQGDFAKVGR